MDGIYLSLDQSNPHLMLRFADSDKRDSNNTYLSLFMVDKPTIQTKIMILFLNKLMDPFMFKTLREEHDLGYVAQTTEMFIGDKQGLKLLLIGEKFRPANIEAMIEDLIKDFIKYVNNISNTHFDNTLQSVMDDIVLFQDVLINVAEKQWDWIQDKIVYRLDHLDYSKIADGITLVSISSFMDELFVRDQRRVTVEMFAHGISTEEEDFKGESAISLGNVKYQVVGVKKALQIRDESIQRNQ